MPQRRPLRVIASVELDEDIDTLITLGDEGEHIRCCLLESFFCGHPYHPELEIEDRSDEDECCPACVDIMYKTMCPPSGPTSHYHCPIRGRTFGAICPAR